MEDMSSKEECNSNESGWTMYIGSPYRDYNQDDDDDIDERRTPVKGYMNPDDDHVEDGGGSDDSMTSDASSGPSHQGVCTDIEQIYGKHAEKDIRKFSSKEQQKQAKKKLSDNKNTKAAKEKEDSGHKAKSGKGYGHFRSTTRGKHAN